MGLIKTAAKVAVASSVHGRVQRRQQQRWAAQDQAAAMQETPAGVMAEPSAAAAPRSDSPTSQAPVPLSTADKISQLKTLGELRDGGVLTDSEFENEKRKLLDG
ncbi:MAG: SHOCT domain-containing protein [Solirubrobacterales bacterium]|nr:SHOCT domain-containing protein [Solirubrobacterales bacterium]